MSTWTRPDEALAARGVALRFRRRTAIGIATPGRPWQRQEIWTGETAGGALKRLGIPRLKQRLDANLLGEHRSLDLAQRLGGHIARRHVRFDWRCAGTLLRVADRLPQETRRYRGDLRGGIGRDAPRLDEGTRALGRRCSLPAHLCDDRAISPQEIRLAAVKALRFKCEAPAFVQEQRRREAQRRAASLRAAQENALGGGCGGWRGSP